MSKYVKIYKMDQGGLGFKLFNKNSRKRIFSDCYETKIKSHPLEYTSRKLFSP